MSAVYVKKLFFLIVILITAAISGCGKTAFHEEAPGVISTEKMEKEETFLEENLSKQAPLDTANPLIVPEEMTLSARIRPPEGYERTEAAEGSLAEFLRKFPLKESESPVLLYDGSQKRNQKAHAAVFSLSVGDEDLQQCADSVMRIYAEYFWETKQYEKIAFHFVNGFLAEYVKWRDGYRISVAGNDTEWIKSASYDDSYETFAAYLRMVFAYAGTLSMEAESYETELSGLRAGDVFLKGASPGHVVMVLDVCENADGKKAFLLGQGYMPAQEFHVLKNPSHEENPWYYEEEIVYPFCTPEYYFEQGSLRRLRYEEDGEWQ